MSAHDLKQLQTRKAKLQAEIQRLEQEAKDAGAALTNARVRLAGVNAEISRATQNPVVSEHAMLRYMERVMGLDLELVRREILTAEREKLIRTLGDGSYPIGANKMVVKGMTVVSIV